MQTNKIYIQDFGLSDKEKSKLREHFNGLPPEQRCGVLILDKSDVPQDMIDRVVFWRPQWLDK